MPEPSFDGKNHTRDPDRFVRCRLLVPFSQLRSHRSATRPDPGFTLGNLLPRIRSFAWEVLLQGKVIRERPAAGVAHAFVFWGFCAFALITVNHIATGFGFPLLSRTGGFGRVYFGFVALFAVAVSLSIVYLAVRRFILRPVWLGKVSPESGSSPD